jgi:hypothetical protein
MKQHLLVTVIVAACVLPASHHARADLVSSNSLDARVQGGTLANNANLAATGSNPGYLEIKSGSSLTSGSRKSYFHFNVGSNVNTNANAVFTLQFPIITPASQAQRVQLWVLNQAYSGGFNPASMTWNNAQANDTNSNSGMLTDPTNTYTATALASVVLPTADSTHTFYTFTLPGGASAENWGGFVTNGALTLVLSGIPDGAYNANGPIRSPTNASYLSFNTPIGAGPMPSISVCTNVTTYWSVNSPTNYFTVSPSGLTPTATSDDQAVVADGNIYINGSGANWNVYAVGGTNGTANIVLTITDSYGNPANANFKVTVRSIEPVMSSVPDTNTLVGVPVTVPFTTYEVFSNANNITIWATSLNTNLVADSGLVLTKDSGGTNRTVTVTPLPGADGTAPIALWASDGANSNRTTFALLVRSSGKIALMDHFAYTTNLTSGGNPTLADNFGRLEYASAQFWNIRAGATGHSLLVSNNQAFIYYNASTATPQSLKAALAGGPYATNQGRVIYSSFRATWLDTPINSSEFFHLYDSSATGGEGRLARVSTSISNSPSGQFRVRIANGDQGTNVNVYAEFPLDLTVGQTYTIATRFNVDTATATLWVDPVDLTSTSVTAADSQPPHPVSDVGLRQANMADNGPGPVLIDDLKVTVDVPPIRPTLTGIVPPSGGYVYLNFTAGTNDTTLDFVVMSTVNLATAFADVTSGVTFTSSSPGIFTAKVPAVSGTRAFYRVRRVMITFP